MLTPLDLLYITLAIAIALLAIFLCITLVYMILILRDINRVVDTAKDTVEKVNVYVMKPIQAAKNMGKYMGPVIKIAEEKIIEKMTEQKEATPKKKTTKKKK